MIGPDGYHILSTTAGDALTSSTHTHDDVKTVLLVVAGQITKWTVLVEDLG